MCVRSRGAALLGAGLVLASPPARADDSFEEVSISYEGESCATPQEFQREVRARTDKYELVPRAEDSRHFSVVIERTARGYSATLSITSADSGVKKRAVEGDNCDELLDAMALMTALAIDPAAPALVAADGDTSGDSGDETGPEDPSQTPGDSPPLAKETARAKKRGSKGGDGTRTTTAADPVPIRVGAGAHFAVNWGIVGEPLYGGTVDLAARWDGPAAFSPEFRAIGLYQAGASVDAEAGSASFVLMGAQLQACPVRILEDTTFVRPCLVGTLAALSGEGQNVDDGRRETKAFAALGAAARIGILVFSRTSLAVEGGLHFPLRRDRFILGEEVVSQAAPIVGSGRIGMTFWL